MSDDYLRDKIVQYFMMVLLALVVLFLIYGLVKGKGDNDPAGAPTPVAATPQAPVALEAQVGCQQPANATTTTRAKGRETIPPNPGVSALRSGKSATISVAVPTSTQECRVAKVRVQLDSASDRIPATTRTVSVLTGPSLRKIKVTLPSGGGAPDTVRAFAVTPDGRSSSGATVSVRPS